MEAENFKNTLQKLFPDLEYQTMAEGFCRVIAGVDGVSELLTLSLGGPRRVFVIAQEELKEDVKQKVNELRGSFNQALLGSTPVCTRDEFEEIWQKNFGGPENVVSVWPR